MTNELEKQFFDTFGIEFNLSENAYFTGAIGYPQITDRHYLELISELSGVTKPHFVFERGVEELKHDILKQCMFYNKELKHQVQALFKEGV